MVSIHCSGVSVFPFGPHKNPLPDLRWGGFARVFLGFHLVFYLWIYSSCWANASELFDQTHVLRVGKALFHSSKFISSITCVALALVGLGLNLVNWHHPWGILLVCWLVAWMRSSKVEFLVSENNCQFYHCNVQHHHMAQFASNKGGNTRCGRGHRQGQGHGRNSIQAQSQLTIYQHHKNIGDLILEATRPYRTNTHPRSHQIIFGLDSELKHHSEESELEFDVWRISSQIWVIPEVDTPSSSKPFFILDDEKSLGKSYGEHLCKNFGVNRWNTRNPSWIPSHLVWDTTTKCSSKPHWEAYSLPSTNWIVML